MTSFPAVAGMDATPFAVQLPLIHAGLYCFVHRIPALIGINAAPNLQELTTTRVVKILRLDSTLQLQIGFINMLASLSSQRAAAPAAYTHRHITAFRIIDINIVADASQHTSLALTTPWYGNGDIMNYRNRFPHGPLLSLVIQAATGLWHLHRHRVVHGHIHPGNIYITDSGCATITDTSVYTEACRCMLHPFWTIPLQAASRYQAPEFLWPGTDAFVYPTAAMDVYAFASTIYAIFTGTPPFSGLTLVQAVAEILFHGHLRIKKPAVISENLWDIMQRCWARDPAARPLMPDVVIELEDTVIYAPG